MVKKIGDLGERFVRRYLEIKGYKILKHNWRSYWGEIDLIAQEKITNELAFIEVKTRRNYNWDADGLLAINSDKQAKLIKTASLFLAQYPQLAELPCRFDVALVSYQPWETTNHCQSDFTHLNQIEIGQAIIIKQHKLTIKNYLPTAFD